MIFKLKTVTIIIYSFSKQNALDANVLSNVYFNTRGDDDVMIRLIDNSLWSKMSSYLQDYAESITLAQLCDEYIKNNEIEHNIPMYYI